MNENEQIYRVFIDDRSQSVFVGFEERTLNQVDLRNKKMIKKYIDLGIEEITCLSSFDNLLLVGGDNYRFTLINISERRVLTVNALQTPIEQIKSAQFSIIDKNNKLTVALIISGGKSLNYI